MTCVLVKGEKTQRHREEGHVKTKEETGVMLPQIKGHQEPQEAGRGKKGFSHRAMRRSMT